jgi:hypothetical protein
VDENLGEAEKPRKGLIAAVGPLRVVVDAAPLDVEVNGRHYGWRWLAAL